VSRSHSGSVKEVAEQSFGANVEVIPAGGAGELMNKRLLLIIR
jgi:hypothetical protein